MTCAAGQIVALEGDPGSGMFVILDGTARVEWRGGSVDLGPGTFFGELTLLAPGGTRIARVRAATEMRCLAIPRDDAIALVESEPSVALAMLREIARRFASRFRTRAAQDRDRFARVSRSAPDPRTRLLASPASLHSGGGQADRNQADRREPPRATRVRAHRARRGGRRAHRDRGEVGARRARSARTGLRGHPGRRGVAHRRVDLGVRARRAARPPVATATASSSSTAARSTRCTGRCARRASRSSRSACTSRTAA